MIRLKNIIFNKQQIVEQRGNEQRKKLHVLFVGDEETNSDLSYAKKILNTGIITGEIVADENITSDKLKRLVETNIADDYDIVCIMDDGRDPEKFSAKQSISNLNDAFVAAKQFDAKLIVIANATNREGESDQTKLVNKWITKVQTITDNIIDLSNITTSNSYNKSGFLIPEVHTYIVRELIRLIIGYVKSIQISSDADPSDSKNVYQWIISDLKNQVDAKVIIKSLDYGDTENLGWLTTKEAWEQAKRNHDIVYKIQMQLAKLRYNLGGRGATGDYNKDTERAIRTFQEINNLPTTGDLDLKTVATLFYKDALPADYSPANKNKKSAEIINVDAAWKAITDKVIDNFEGGYWNHDKTQPADKICTNHPYTSMFANSGETMFGLDRRAGGIDKIKPYGEQFFAIIDAEKARLGSAFCSTWVHGYRGGDKEPELKTLAAKVTYDLYQKYANSYLSNKSRKVVESSKRLLFHFAYAVWNGPLFFKNFAKVIDNGVAQGKTVDQLIDDSIAARNARFGGTDWAKGNTKVVNIIKSDPDLA
jgi:peptidoglycan hydrolase-like protein with peptidoglycan-binding domain/DNA-binding ferritin-like protein (Dps family)